MASRIGDDEIVDTVVGISRPRDEMIHLTFKPVTSSITRMANGF